METYLMLTGNNTMLVAIYSIYVCICVYVRDFTDNASHGRDEVHGLEILLYVPAERNIPVLR